MLEVTIEINGKEILRKAAVNQQETDEMGKTVYAIADGQEIRHDREEGAVALARKMLSRTKESETEGLQRPDHSVFLNRSLRRMAKEQPCVATPPLLVGVDVEADHEVVTEWIDGNVAYHDTSAEAEVIAEITVSVPPIRAESLPTLADHDAVETVEIQGYLKTMDPRE